MSETLGRLVVEIGASLATLQTDFQRAQGITDKAVADINVSINKIGSSANFSGVSSQVQGLIGEFNSLKTTIAGVFGVSIGVAGLKDIAGLADEYQNASNRIRSTVSDSQQLLTIQRELFQVAQETGYAYDATAKTYQRLEQVIQGTGKSQAESQAQAIALTKTLNEEIVVSGASAGEASRAVMDLVHGLAGGELQSRQFVQIMRQMPDLAKQIADGMGVSVQQLEKMVHAGLPAVDVLRALANQSDVIDQRFNNLPITFARAWQELSNAVQRYVGEASQASAVSELVKTSIIGIANNINVVAAGAEAAGVAMAAWLGGKGLQSIGSLVGVLGDMVTAQGAYKTAAIASAEADIANAAAKAQSAAATIAHVDATNDLRIVELQELQAKQGALITEEALLVARQRALPVGINVIAEEERLIAVRTELAASTTRLATLEDAMAASQIRATMAEQAETAATTELALAKQGLAVASAEATAATGLFARAGAGLLAMVGGWPTVAVAAGAGLLYLATRESEAQQAAEALAKVTDDVTRSHGAMTPALEKSAEAAYMSAKAMLDLAQANAKFAETNFSAVAAQGGEAAMQMGADLGRAQADVRALSEQMNNLAGAILKAKLAAAGKAIYDALFPDLRSALAQIDALTDGIDKQTAKFQEQAATYGKGHAAQVQYEKDLELQKLSLGQSADAIAVIKKALDDQYAGELKAAAALDKATASAKENRKELTEQQKALNAYQSDLGKLADLEEQLSSGLDGPYLAALKSYQKGVDLLKKTWDDAWVAGKANTELAQRIGDDLDRLDAKLQDTNARLKEHNDILGNIKNAYEQEERLTAALGIQHDILAAIIKAENEARQQYEQHQRATPTLTQAEIDSITSLTQAHVGYMQELKNSQEQLKEWQQIATNAFDSAFSAINKDILEGGDVMKDLVNVAKSVVEQILLQFEKLAIINPILNQVFGLSGSSALPTSSFGSIFNNLGSLFGGAGAGAFGATGAVSTAGTDIFAGGVLDGVGPSGAVSTAGGGLSGTSAGSILGGGYGAGIPGFGAGFSGAGVLGGVFAGIGAYQAAGGGLGGLGAGAAYGIGTAALTTAIGAGVTAAAAGGISAGLSAGFLAIPVVGWIALAAMAVNMISGGKLFGTAWKPYGSEENLSVGAGGATITAAIDEKKQKALFGGTAWKTKSAPVDQSTQDSVAKFFEGLQAAADAEAKAFGGTTGTVVAGSFHETFDKAGKMLTQESTILGKKFKESIDDFQTRLMADTLLANLPAAAGAQEIAERWQSSAKDLLAGAEFLSQAELDISQGHGLVQTDTLAQLTDFVQGMEAQGETLIQAYARLSAETTVMVTILGNLDISTSKTGEALVSFSDDMVKAAGGLQNLNTLFNDYWNNYFSGSERAAAKLKADQASAAALGTAIGQDPTESMAQFRANFTAIFDSLSAEDVVKWLQFAEALTAINQDLGTTAGLQQQSATQQLQAAAQYQAFIAQFSKSDVTQFESAFNAMGATLGQNIDQANALARAMGQQGAAADDIATIITRSAEAGVVAIRQFEAQAMQLSQKLYGTDLDQLKSRLGVLTQDGNSSLLYVQQIIALQKQIADGEAQQQAAARLGDATALLSDFAQIGSVTGGSLTEIAKQIGTPLDKLAGDLGLTQDGLNAAFAEQEAQAQAAIKSEAWLEAIYNTLNGKPVDTPIAHPLLGVFDKDGSRGVSPIGGTEVAAAVRQQTDQSATDSNRLLTAVLEQNTLLRAIMERGGFNPPQSARSARGYAIP